ncbi:MAG: NAD-dependent deacylase [Verrucomicrobia bacterium]|nr:NAD-dependent deacylase [Verrucomicrobiota bacterium]
MRGGKCVVLSGAGISAESGLQTFRGSDGLWNGYSVYDVATVDAWQRNAELVLEFYNMRRQNVRAAKPNPGHLALAHLERFMEVRIVTQNIDDLHERAGSSKVLHLHGEIMKARSSVNDDYLLEIGGDDIRLGDLCPQGSQLRPHVVWFGETVTAMAAAERLVRDADILIVVGTSLQVYPAAGLIDCVQPSCCCYVVDTQIPKPALGVRFQPIVAPASLGLPQLVREITGS